MPTVRASLAWAALIAGTATGAALLRQSPRTESLPRRLVPEAERTLRRIVLGLQPNATSMVMVPETMAWDPHTRDPRVRWLRRQIYRLEFELVHGGIFRAAPPRSRFFVAVPDSRTTPESMGNEEEVFREYLRQRIGWSDAIIDARVRFYTVPTAIPFPQDMAEPVGYDERGRLVLAIGSDAEDYYRAAVERIVQAFPQDFTIRRLPGVNTEGGDLALVRLPEGTVGLLVGHNRIRRWVDRVYGSSPGAPIPESQISEAQDAYRRAFGGIEILVLGREALVDPRLANPEIFHVDMVAAVLRGPAGIAAFVPTYHGTPIDAVTTLRLEPEAVARFQAEYDRAASQLAARGYRVARIPFADHPVRNPVNVGKYTDAETARSYVLLGRYPDHLPSASGLNARAGLQRVLDGLDAAVGEWRKDSSEKHWAAVQAAVAAAWTAMDRSTQAPNPIFESQRGVYESYGIGVGTVPIFPTGEGGVHCLVLQ
jgi:hypothetical protein